MFNHYGSIDTFSILLFLMHNFLLTFNTYCIIRQLNGQFLFIKNSINHCLENFQSNHPNASSPPYSTMGINAYLDAINQQNTSFPYFIDSLPVACFSQVGIKLICVSVCNSGLCCFRALNQMSIPIKECNDLLALVTNLDITLFSQAMADMTLSRQKKIELLHRF